ncbi:TonB-dependent receptor plug domain-containing protein [bacterium]|nr:TonB-dependent receptor plug domain-containing protein [bacterium]
MNKLLIFLLSFSITIGSLYSRDVIGSVKGNSSPLVGANIFIEDTDIGTAADADGLFVLNVPSESFVLSVSMLGFAMQTQIVDAGTEDVAIDFVLKQTAIGLSDIEVLASRTDATTPVASTLVTKEEMEVRLGSQDIPMILNTTPSVYATQQGGGAGDARINIRGFNQRNVSVMINGVPQNDMENGWVYWSNWDGVGDATSSIEVQRGLSAVNLATPSIGGTMNIITDPASHEKGGKIKTEGGAGNFKKMTVSAHSGLINDKVALSATVVRKVGDGIIDKTWTDAWAYYFGGSYQMNKNHRFALYAIGAPQRHGQNLYKQNIGAYDHDFAASVDGYDEEAIAEDGKFKEVGQYFNQNWSPVDESYKGKQYWYMYGANITDRYDPNFINERENFFHKPLVNLNHFFTINDKTRLSSVLYWSGGSGGGTGTYGKIPTMDADGALGGEDYKFYYGRGPWTRDWNTLIDYNSGDQDTVYVDKSALVRTHGEGNNQSVGILRNSINRQDTYGLISKLNYDVSNDLKIQLGIDWRTASIEHAREVRDLMGGDYYMDYADANYADGKRVGLGDIIAYHNSTTVDWLGTFIQANYTLDNFNLYGMAGFSSIAYSYQDHFSVENKKITADAITATQFKGGAMYALNDNLNVFGNFGLVEKPPILDNVIYYDGTVASDPANEKFQSLETGINYNSEKLAVKTNVYSTDWKDRNLTKAVNTGEGDSGDTDIIYLTGVNQRHVGFEMEASYEVHSMVRLDAALGLGDWRFVGDASGDYQEMDYDENGNVVGQVSTSYDYALDGLYVGDMPQTSFVLGTTLTPIKGLQIQTLYNQYANNYADWSPDSREYSGNSEDADTEQVWKAPDYSKVDIHLSYDLPFKGLDMKLSGHVFNALNSVYVQDATDNSKYNSYGDKVHAAHNAEVFLGTPRHFNLGLEISF